MAPSRREDGAVGSGPPLEQTSRFASYRDPDSRIRVEGDQVVREFSPKGADSFRGANAHGVLRELAEEGLVVDYAIEESETLRVVSNRIPFVSYPAEWTSGMLKEAGLLTLEIARRLWAAGFHLRDASAYNVVFEGTTPRFVDLGSIGLGNTPLWSAYGQFCDHFLNPLLIEVKTGVPFQPLWTLEGIPVATTRKILHGWKGFGSGAFRNVMLRARLESSLEDAGSGARRAARTELGISPAQVDRMLMGMSDLLESLEVGGVSHWATYTAGNSYDEAGEARRDDMIREFSAKGPGGVALDIGTNTGRHASVLAEHYETVVALDSDATAIEAARARFETDMIADRVYPVVADIANPTPGLGLLNQERIPLLDRLTGVAGVTWMAVVHHLVIGRSIPLEALAALAARLSSRHLIEFVDLDDPMSQLLAASKGDEHHPYDQQNFEKAFGEYFNVTHVGQTLDTRPVFELFSG